MNEIVPDIEDGACPATIFWHHRFIHVFIRNAYPSFYGLVIHPYLNDGAGDLFRNSILYHDDVRSKVGTCIEDLFSQRSMNVKHLTL
jgi:hypothetical protein